VRAIRAAALGAWEFVVGDDWRIALGVAAALAITALAADATSSVWWIVPAATALVLAGSLWRAARRR